MNEPARKRPAKGRRPSRQRRTAKRQAAAAAGDGGRTKAAGKKGGRAPRRRRPKTRWRPTGRALLLVLLGIVVGSAASVVLGLWWFAARPGPALDRRVAVNWPSGLDASEAAQLLADLGLVDHPATMAIFLRATGATDCFERGPHLLPAQASAQQLRALLCRTADRPRAKVTIPEGYSRFAIATRLDELGVTAREAFLHSSAEHALLGELGVEAGDWEEAYTAEGYLFPATYDLPLDSDPSAVVRRLVREADRRWRRLAAAHPNGLAELRETRGWGRRQVLTLASMVEKEAAEPEERGLVASVFLNRLRDPSFTPKVLQSDPTAIYGCYAMPQRIVACQRFSGRATPALNHDPSNRYSTYLHPRLPPGPIANPGHAAIEAVLDPPRTAYLYFVAAGDGRHTFSETLEEHNEAVRRLKKRTAKDGGH